MDGTVGMGGHAGAILEQHSGARLLGLDRDEAAVSRAAQHLRRFGDRAAVRHDRFSNWLAACRAMGHERVDGLLLDLGVSSLQLDTSERGFSFRADAPLDMRMDRQGGLTAREFLEGLTPPEVAKVLRDYGEERLAWPIAKAICRERDAGRLRTTGDLAAICRRVYPRGPQRIDPATRTFQALRIAVNDELGELSRALDDVPQGLNVGGVVCVISFHSLEDRVVKQRFSAWQQAGQASLLKRKPIMADEAEVAANPRASSAKLRALLWGVRRQRSTERRSRHHRNEP